MNSIDQELIVVALENNVPEVSRLLRAGADVNVKDWRDRTPLQVVSIFGHEQVVKELLDHGAYIEAKGISGLTALHCACCLGRVAVVIELLSRHFTPFVVSTDGLGSENI
jgi:ankyrin repeat protein